MRVLCWNLFHGRSVPPAGRDLLDEYAATIAGWDWDVALLQEVQPWWPAPLGARCAASARMKLTSRNLLPALQHPLARALPDLLGSWGGGCNAILVRGQAITDHRWQLLTRRPERRYVHGVRLADGTWVANLHASKADERAAREAPRAAAAASTWTGSAPALLGGDFNIDAPEGFAPGFARLAGGGVDFVLGRSFARVGAEALDAGRLSDHRPIRVEVRRT